jgi:type II secretory pathway pseudopilin PulG
MIELLVVTAIVGILTALIVPTLHRSNAQAQNAVCASQLLQLGLAVRLYADDNANTFPSAELLPTLPINLGRPLPAIRDILLPYVSAVGGSTQGTIIFKCPADNRSRFVTEGSSYEWNTDLNGHKLDATGSQTVHYSIEINDSHGTTTTNGTTQLLFPPDTTPLLLDYDNFHPRAMASGKNVVFMDDHVAPLETWMTH